MQIIGLDQIRNLIDSGEGFEAKCVFNRSGAIFFPVQQQHRDQKVTGISYEDDYKGNALAAMLTPGRFDVRYHARYSDKDVTAIVTALAAMDGLAFLSQWGWTYQGRPVGGSS